MLSLRQHPAARIAFKVKPGVAETLDLAECGPKVEVSIFPRFIASMNTFLTATVEMLLKGLIREIKSLEFSFRW